MSLVEKEFSNELACAIDKVCSPVYQQLFEKVNKENIAVLSQEERTILASYPNVISWYEGERRPEIVERIRTAHLKWFDSWLVENNTGQPPYLKWSATIENAFLHLTNLLFRIDLGDNITSDNTRESCRGIANTVTKILLAIKQSNPMTIDSAAIPITRILLLILFYFTMDAELVIHLKGLQIVDLVNTILRISNNDDEIHLQAYRILAVIMAEADIKQMQNSSRIAAVFITFIGNVIDGGVSTEGRLHNSLRSLKVLAQHDDIREELIKQQGHSLFVRCAIEDKFSSLKAKLPSLQILLALAQNKEFAATLKANTAFVNHVRTLTTSSQQELQLVATALIWKLEKEVDETRKRSAEPTSSPATTRKPYDVMISYSHSDKELCHRVLDALSKDHLRVWIDTQLMHGATFDAMAKAIENAEFVLVCMSDAYKQSPFCEMEASYAIKRRCRIVPLVMTPNYKADGWLGVLTSALIYVDFPKLGFDKAYLELKKQIELYRANSSSSAGEEHRSSIQHNLASPTADKPKPSGNTEKKKEVRPKMEYPHSIDTWTEEHVRSFLLEKELDILLGAFDGMNGSLLHQVYNMCQSNQHGMFCSLKEDCARSQLTKTLSLKEYLVFLDALKSYVPYKLGDRSNVASAVCSLM